MLIQKPMREAKSGYVYAIKLHDDSWGYIRFESIAIFGILPVYSRQIGMPAIEWKDDSEKWHGSELSGSEKYESDDFVLVGQAPFHDPLSFHRPDMYQQPSFPWQPWFIFRKGEMIRVNGPEDVVGLQRHRYMNAGSIQQLITEKYQAGELTEVDVLPIPEVKCDNNLMHDQECKDGPKMVYAKIVQSIRPLDREQIYELPLEMLLTEYDLGEVTGGGTMQDKDGTILFAGIDIEVRDLKRAIPMIAKKLAECGAPEGSVLEYELYGKSMTYPISKSKAKQKSRGRRGQSQ